MSLPKPPVLPAWAEAVVGNPADWIQPPNSFIQTGWPLSSTPPTRQNFNWLENYNMNGVRYLCERGIADWDPAETYSIGDTVRGDDGLIRASLKNNNTGNTPSTTDSNVSSSPWWVPAQGQTPPQSDASNSLATTAYVARAVTSLNLFWSQAAGSFVWYKVATLPAGAVEIGSIALKAVINSGTDTDTFIVDGVFYSRSGGFDFLYNVYGPNSASYQVQVYREANGQYSVYLLGTTGVDALAQVSITNQGYFGPTPANMVVYANPPAFVGVVSGTSVFSSGPGSPNAPLFNAPFASTYLNATQIAAAYATLTQLAATLSSAEGYTNAAVSGLAPLASPSFSGDPQTPTPPGGANDAQIPNTNWVQSRIFGGAALGASGYVVLPFTGPAGTPLIYQWGLVQGVNGGPGPVNVTFPLSFPNICAAMNVSSKRNIVGATPTGYVQNLSGSPGTTLSLNGNTVVIDRDADGVQRGYWTAIGW